MGQQRSEGIEASRARVDRAEQQVRGAWSAWLPQIYGSASYDRTLKSEFEGLLPSAEGSNPTDPMTMDEPNLPFGSPNTYRLGLSASQQIWSGGRISSQIDLARTGRRQAEIALLQARAQAALTTTEAYYDAVLQTSLVEIAETTL